MEAPEDLASSAASGRAADSAGISGVIGDVRRLAEEARTYAEAEAAYQSSRVRVAVGGAGKIAALVGAAAVIAIFALFALVFGLLLGLATLVGPWIATAIVVVVLALAAVILLKAAQTRWRRVMALVFPPKDPL